MSSDDNDQPPSLVRRNPEVTIPDSSGGAPYPSPLGSPRKSLPTSPRYPKAGPSSGGKKSPAAAGPGTPLDDDDANIMLYECLMEVLCEAMPSGKKLKEHEKEWMTYTFVLEGQQITLYKVDKKLPNQQAERPLSITKSASLFEFKDEQEIQQLRDYPDQSPPPFLRSQTFGGTIRGQEMSEALKKARRSAQTDDEIGVTRGSSIRSMTRAHSVDLMQGLDEQRHRSRTEIAHDSGFSIPVPPPQPPAPEFFIGLTGATLKDADDKKLGFRLETEWDGNFAFRTSNQEDYPKLMKQLKVALEWSNKATSVDDKGIARTSHCIPHRFATENLLLKRCRFCAKIITEFRGYRCIHCGDCFHTKCGKFAPPNCGLSSIKDALSNIQMDGGIRKVTDTLSSRMKNKGDKIFAVELHMMPQTEDGIPAIVKLCIHAIENKGGLESVGIYRVSGIKSEVDRLRVYFAFGRPNLIDDEQWNDVNVITGVLKAWFRELPVPLMTYEYYNEFIALPKKKVVNTDDLRRVLLKLPQQNYDILKYLMCHLHKVQKHSAQNKMQSDNLAALFGPNLLRSKTEKDTEINAQMEVVKHMIVQYHEVFES